MRIAIVGQKDFGQAVLEGFIARGDQVVGVYCAPPTTGAPPDPLASRAEALGIPVHRLASLRSAEACRLLVEMQPDIAVLAYVVQFVPQQFASIPKFGTLQFHPSLLPRYRGPSAINWAIIRGDTQTGLTIFRPTEGLDEGPVVLQKQTRIDADDTAGSLYFERLLPMGVAALIEAVDGVARGLLPEQRQDEPQASYEGWCREAEAQIHWHTHVDHVYNLIRGCNPAPGAWTMWQGSRLQLFDAKKHVARTLEKARGGIGVVVAIGEHSVRVNAQGGQIEVFRVRPQGGRKMSAPQFCAEANLPIGTQLGT